MVHTWGRGSGHCVSVLVSGCVVVQPAMANSVANSYALSIVGGGDTDVAVHESGETDRITYISTGGGAFLALLEGKILPAVAALDL